MSSKNPFLRIEGLTITFIRWGQTVKALNEVSFSVEAGQWVILVGHNGSGKTTLLNTICGRLKTHKGEIYIDNKSIDILSAPQISNIVFHIHQDPLLGTAPTLSILENLLVADYEAQNKKIPRKQIIEKYHELLRPLGLSDRKKQLVKYLSGGERQLLALLISQLRPAPLLLLDEPLAALDPAKSELCFQLIKKLHSKGKTIIQVTHDKKLALMLGDRTIVLKNGSIAYDVLRDKRNLNDIIKNWNSIGEYDSNDVKNE